jgi:glutamyl-tRNA synthetase
MSETAAKTPANQTVVTRFAPSPTGFLHVGGARTALYNWMFARKVGGRFLLRIEDTDQGRHVPMAEQAIFDSLSWLGILWDEGPAGSRPGLPEHGGPNGPYRQSERRHIYDRYFEKLLAEGRAYRDFTSQEELEAMRRDAERRKVPFVFRKGPLPEAAERAALAEGKPHVLRLKMPGKDILVRDQIRGDVNYPADTLDDFVIRKGDGWPTYHMGVVVDDALMQVSHVIRAAEHLANTPRHIALQEACGFPTPVYAHIPVVLNANGSKMSKRNKGAKVEDYRAMGFVPAALVNYMALVGWSPGEDREIMPVEEMVRLFDLDRINKSNGRWDLKKCLHFNKEYILHRTPAAELRSAVMDWLGHEVDKWLPHFKVRMGTISEFVQAAAPLWVPEYNYDRRAFDEAFGADAGDEPVLFKLGLKLADADFAPAALNDTLTAAAEPYGGLGKVGQRVRLAVSGRTVSPPLHDMLASLGKDETIRRFARTLAEAADSAPAGTGWRPLYLAARLSRKGKRSDDALDYAAAALKNAPATEAKRAEIAGFHAHVLCDQERFEDASKAARELVKTHENDARALGLAATALMRAAEDNADIKRRNKAYEEVITLAGKAAEKGSAAPEGLAGLALKAYGLHRIGKDEPAAKVLAGSPLPAPPDAAGWKRFLEEHGPKLPDA